MGWPWAAFNKPRGSIVVRFGVVLRLADDGCVMLGGDGAWIDCPGVGKG
jgi:hypothetical protein